MSHQITKVDLIPNGELSVCNVSQFDNGRVLPFEILENKEAYNIPNDIRVELHCRKPDGNIVTLPSESISNNIVTFLSTTQLTACYGKNICEIALYGPDDYLIGSGNFILEVEKSPTLGGINSTSAIHDLEDQIRDIAEDVIPEILPGLMGDYYTKSEVDALIDNIFPTFTASGTIATFTTALVKPLVSVSVDVNATTVTRCGKNLFDNIFPDIDNTVRYKHIRTGNGTFTMSTNAPIVEGAAILFFLAGYVSSGANTAINGVSNGTPRTVTTTDGYITVAYRTYGTPTVNPSDYDTIINFGAIASSYEAYNSQTVPVSEATTLVTLSGVNNVFADVGDVTVGYKYMPMPETPNNSNRLLLSSVNSDIIKEKSEIKEQSDIVEDIERGEENE